MSNRRRMITSAGTRIEHIKDLPIGSKILLSSGKKFVVQAKNVSGHEANSVTLVGEFVTENYKWSIKGTSRYEYSEIHKTIMQRYYNELNEIEKKSIINRNFKYAHELEGHATPGTYYFDINSHFWIPSGKELNLPSGIGADIGFTDNASRKKKLENGSPSGYYTSSSYEYAWYNMSENQYYCYVVNSDGAEEKTEVVASFNNLTDFTTGILPCCDVKGDSVLRYKSGYWHFE